MTASEMLQLAVGLGEAKSRQNVADALKFMHPDMLLTSPAWGTRAQGKDENSKVLKRFFDDFPDYSIALDGHVCDETDLVCWGTVRMTMAQGAYDLSPNGRRVEIPAFLHFTFKDGLIASEYFMVDLAAICAQSGVSTDEVQAFLRAARGQRAA